jgi:hypothetical protein
LSFSLQGALRNAAKEEIHMFTTRRKLVRYAFSASLGALLPPGMRRARASGKPLDADINVTEFLMEWAELADWREIRGPNPAGPMHNGIMLSMSRKYVRDYFERRGEVPTGAHHVRYSVGSDPSNDVYCGYVSGSRVFDELFTYLGGGRLSIRVLPR